MSRPAKTLAVAVAVCLLLPLAPVARAAPIEKIAFVSDRDGNQEIYTMDPSGDNQERVTDNSDMDRFPSLSRYGSIAFDRVLSGNNRDIHKIDVDGGNLRQLAANAYEDASPAWSPNGTRIAFESMRSIVSADIWIMDADGGALSPLTGGPLSQWNSSNEVEPTWSPNGAILAFTSTYDGSVDIWTINDDRNYPDPKNRTNSDSSVINSSPSWSPDGRKIAFMSNRVTESNPQGDNEIYTMDADGRDIRQRTFNSFSDTGPDWSPDGTKIAFNSDRNGNLEIYTMNEDGSEQENISGRDSADQSPSWELADISPRDDPIEQIDGAAAGDQAGFSVAGAGDVNNDGRDDVIVGAPYADNAGPARGPDYGSAYVVFGQAAGATVNLANIGRNGNTQGFRIDGAAAGDLLGHSAVAGAGNVNGDEFDDVIVGASQADSGNGTRSGSAYVVYGKQNNATVNAANIGTNGNTQGFRIKGGGGDWAGFSVAGVSKIDGDGLDDVIVGAFRADNNGAESGSAYVVYGKQVPPGADDATVNLANIGTEGDTQGFRIDGGDAGDWAGNSVSGAGDLNHDQRPDLIVGAPQADGNVADSGSAYVIYSPQSQPTSPIVLDRDQLDSEPSLGFRIKGATADDRAGDWVAGAHDVNGDQVDDVIVSAPQADANGRDSGSAYVVYGSDLPLLAGPAELSSLGERGFRINGAAAGDRAGDAVAGVGNVDGDGFDDVVVSAIGADNGGTDSGSAYVLYGKRANAPVNLANIDAEGDTRGFRIDGRSAGEWASFSVAGAGKVDDDPFADVIVGAPLADHNRTNSGSAYIVYGFGPETVQDPDCDDDPHDNTFAVHDFTADTPDTHEYGTLTATVGVSEVRQSMLVCGAEPRESNQGLLTLTDHIDIREPPGVSTNFTGTIPVGSYAGRIGARLATHDGNGNPKIEQTTASLRVDRLPQPQMLDMPLPDDADECSRESARQVRGDVTGRLLTACFTIQSDPGSPVQWQGLAWITLSSVDMRRYLTIGPINSDTSERPAGPTKVSLLICGYAGNVGASTCGTSLTPNRWLHKNGFPTADSCQDGRGQFAASATNKDGQLTASVAPAAACVEWYLPPRIGGMGADKKPPCVPDRRRCR